MFDEAVSKLSVIIPTLDEASHLAATLESLRNPLVHEVIVVDGGSRDDTVALAREAGCRVIEEVDGGRTGQMNRGAKESEGSLLLFLHADTVIPALSLKRMKIAMGGSDALAGGGFARRFASPSLLLAVTSRIAGLRGRLLGVFLGDQGIFVRKDAFDLLGGFDETFGPGEDIDLSVRMKRLGKTRLITPPVLSSARRFDRMGPWRQTMEDWRAGREMYRRATRKGTS